VSEREPLEGRLTPVYDELRIAAMWQRIVEARAPRSRPRPLGRWVLAGGIAALGALGTLVVLAWPEVGRVAPLTSVDPAVRVSPGAIWTSDRPVILDDDSTIRARAGWPLAGARQRG